MHNGTIRLEVCPLLEVIVCTMVLLDWKFVLFWRLLYAQWYY